MGRNSTSSPAPTYKGSRQGLLTRIANPISARARARRYSLYRRLLHPGRDTQIIDVGCGPQGLAGFDHLAQITGVDVTDQPGYPGEMFVRNTALELPFADGSFEIAYSNSVIEHLMPGDRMVFAAEMRRVAPRYWVQTPNKWFPVESHVLLPGFQFLPKFLQKRLWRFGVCPGPYEEIHLLDARELRSLFPDATIIRERFGPLTKSLIAVGPEKALGVPE